MKSASVLSPRDIALIRNYLLGGGALGGGAALLTSLNNHLNTLKSEGDDSSKDDDTLYVNLPKGSKVASLGGGLALAGGAVATLGSYALVRKAYQAIKRKRLQQALDDAQVAYLDSAQAEKPASEGKPMGMVEFLTSAPIALPILLGLGSGALSHKFLNEAFPARRKRQTVGPRRVVLQSEPEREGEEKLASDSDGAEFLTYLVLGTKEASFGDLPNLVAAVAAGRADEVENTLVTVGADAAFDMVKGASLNTPNTICSHVAVSYLCKSAALGDSYNVLLASEFAEMSPELFKAAGELPDSVSEALIGVVNTLGAAMRHDIMSSWFKSGGVVEGGGADSEGALRRFLGAANEVPESDTNISETGEQGTGDEMSPDVLSADAVAKKFRETHKDVIDQVLSGAV